MSVLSDDKIAYSMGFANAHELREFIVWPTDFFDSVRAAIAADRAARAEPKAVGKVDSSCVGGMYWFFGPQREDGELLYTAPPAAPVVPDGMVLVPADVVEFLRGAAPLDGVWFGDRNPNERGAFWWRKRLSAAHAQGQDNGGAA